MNTTSPFVSPHSAPGPMAGYLFQSERALSMLAKSKTTESVGIEYIDDVSTSDEVGNILYREQDKHSIKENGEPFKNRSKDLWNTLDIWIQDAKNNRFDLKKTQLVCVTNKRINANALIKKIAKANNEDDVKSVIKTLKAVSKSPPESIKTSIENVLNEESILYQLIPRIEFIEGNDLNMRSEEIKNLLHLNDNIGDEVLTDIRGWLNEQVLAQLENGKAPLIRKKDFNNRLTKAVTEKSNDRVVFMAKSLVQGAIPENEKKKATSRIFVQQLELMEHYDKPNIILDAIDDFLCSEHQRTRLTQKGDLTKRELEEIDSESKTRWMRVFRRKMVDFDSKLDNEQIGKLAFEIYDATIDGYICKIRGAATPEYFSIGTFHKLSDDLEIGWHPHWKSYFNY